MVSGVGSVFSDMNSVSSNKKRLVIRESVIAKRVTQVGDMEPQELTIYYGNYILPKVNGKYLTLKEDKYRRELDNFLNSEEGKIYMYPSEEEIAKASKLTAKFKERTEQEECRQKAAVSINDKIDVGSNGQNTKITSNMKEQVKEEIKPIDIKATNDEIYLSAVKEDSNISKEEVISKAEEIKEEKKSEKRIKELEDQLEKERSKANKERERTIKQLARATQTKDEMTDNFLFKALAVCLIISVCMCFVLMYLYLMK